MTEKEKESEYERNRSETEKINRFFSAACFITITPSVVMFVLNLAALAATVMTAGMVNYFSVTDLLFFAMNCLLVFLCADARHSKNAKTILLLIGAIILRIVLKTAADGEVLGGANPVYVLSIPLWGFGLKLSGRWDFLKEQEGFPNFNISFIKEGKIIANTNGTNHEKLKKAETIKLPPAESPNEMDALEAPDTSGLEYKKQ